MLSRLNLPFLKRSTRRPAGFSMIELLTVVFLIAFMISFLTYAMLKYMNTSKIKAAKAQLQRLGIALNRYYQDFHQYPPDVGYALPDPKTFRSSPQSSRASETVVYYDPGSLYRYLGQSIHWIQQTTNGTVDKGSYGPYMKFEVWELKKYTDLNYGDSFQILDPWSTPIGYIGDPARKIHNRDGVDLYSAGPDKKTASDDQTNLKFPPGFSQSNQAYDGADNDGDGVKDNATELGFAVLDGALTQFLDQKYKKIGSSKSSENTSLDDVNNWDPEN